MTAEADDEPLLDADADGVRRRQQAAKMMMDVLLPSWVPPDAAYVLETLLELKTFFGDVKCRTSL